MSKSHVGFCLLSCLLIPYFIWYCSPCYEVNNMLVCLPRILRVSKNRRMSMFLSFQMDIQLDVCRQTVTRVVNKRTDEKGADYSREGLTPEPMVGRECYSYVQDSCCPRFADEIFHVSKNSELRRKTISGKMPG